MSSRSVDGKSQLPCTPPETLVSTQHICDWRASWGDLTVSGSMGSCRGRDMGYKKVYVASVRQLGSVPIWEMQRILRCV